MLQRALAIFVLLIAGTLPVLSNAEGNRNTTIIIYKSAPVTSVQNNNGPATSFGYTYGPVTQYPNARQDSLRHQPAPAYQYHYERGRSHARNNRRDYRDHPPGYSMGSGYNRYDHRSAAAAGQSNRNCLGSHCNNIKR